MRVSTVSLCLGLAALSSCSSYLTETPRGPSSEERPLVWPKDWSKYLGQSVILEGTAADAKLGALLLGDGGVIWIDGHRDSTVEATRANASV